MNKLFLSLLLLVSSAACANFTIQRIGNFDYVNGDDGYYGVGQRIGNFYYFNEY